MQGYLTCDLSSRSNDSLDMARFIHELAEKETNPETARKLRRLAVEASGLVASGRFDTRARLASLAQRAASMRSV